MRAIDWRQLYASNQATIARAGIGARDPRSLHPLRGSVAALPRSGTRTGRESAVGHCGLRALVHVPHGLARRRPAPLVCMLHGCTQDPATFAAATLMSEAADRHGFVVVYPGQDRGDNPQGCWNWFRPEHQRRDAGEPAAIAGIVLELIETASQCAIDPGRIVVAGLSSGGAMAAILAACYPDLFAAVAVHSGLAYGSATSVGAAFAAMARGSGDVDARGRAAHAAMGSRARPVPTMVIHGDADHTVAPANATEVLRQSMIANHLAAPDTERHDVGHPSTFARGEAEGGLPYTRSRWTDRRGRVMHELLEVHGLGHAWSGGRPGGSYTDARGPDATAAIWRFFEEATSDGPDSRAAPGDTSGSS
jgi:poly(hydroxyalkanoate) depolymerase family esterase